LAAALSSRHPEIGAGSALVVLRRVDMKGVAVATRIDRGVGKRAGLTRRDALALLGAGGTGLWLAGAAPRALGQAAAVASPSCIVRPSHIEGPYFVDQRLERSDIRSDPGDGGKLMEGLPLELEFRVFAAAGPGCKPLPGAVVDIWHCDARGIYSDVEDPNFDTRGKRFLRGYQTSDAQGRVRFQTIYPGAYTGRAVHVHFKIRYGLGRDRRGEFTSQVYFEDALNERVLAQAPYATEAGAKYTRNDKDMFFQDDGGSQLMLDVAQSGNGYRASFELALQDVFPA
jgi:protocatechuate 3,4-dioxygenase beta subunit